jgi:hypothetical protein
MKYPENIYISPLLAIQRFSHVMERCSCDALKKGNRFKEEWEAYIGALVSYGIEKELGCQLYLRNAEHIARDIDIQIIRKPEDGQIGSPIALQITEVVARSGKSVIEVFKNKQREGYEPGDMTLVISVRDLEGCVFDPMELSREINEIGSKYPSIWLLLNENENDDNFHLIQLYPDVVDHQFNVLDSFNVAD